VAFVDANQEPGVRRFSTSGLLARFNYSIMKFWERFGIGIMSLWFVYAVHEAVNALVQAHNWPSMTISDWATWAGSIGTVATLVGTINLARQETRRRHRQEYDAAVIAAAFMDLPLISYRRILKEVIAGLKKPVEDDFENPWEQLAADLGNCPVWTPDDLQPLLYLGNHVAADIALPKTMFGTPRKGLKLRPSKKSAMTIELWELSAFNEETAAVLEEAMRRVENAFGSCSVLLEDARVV
jgi:hypothetical protein